MLRRILIAAAALVFSTSAQAQTAWIPTWEAAATATISAGVASTRIALPTNDVLAPNTFVCNTGAVNAYVALGDSTVTATTSSTLVAKGACRSDPNYPGGTAYSHIAAIAASGSTTLLVKTGLGVIGVNGWTPVLAVVSDTSVTPSRSVIQVIDWTGSTGVKPANGQYLGASGLVSSIASAIDLRGATGPQGSVTSPVAANNAELLATSTASVAGGLILRQSFVTMGDAPPMYYTASASACSLNGGNGDNGSQVKSADNHCWLMVPPAGGPDLREWGCTDSTAGTDCSGALQAAFNWCSSIGTRVNIGPGEFRIDVPLDFTNKNNCTIRGSGWASPQFMPYLPYGTRLMGNTNGKEVIDAIGSNNLVFEDLAISDRGMPTPSKYGIIFGSSTGLQAGYPGGGNNNMKNVGVCLNMAAGSGTVPIYYVNGAGLTQWYNVYTCGAYGFYLTSYNNLNITPTYGTIKSPLNGGGQFVGPATDGIHCFGCTALGSDKPILYFDNVSIAEFRGFYAVCITQVGLATAGCQGGQYAITNPYPVSVSNSVDINLDGLQLDYFPSALDIFGTVDRLRVHGVLYTAGVTVSGSGYPAIARLNGTITNSTINEQLTYGGTSTGGTNGYLYSTVTGQSVTMWNNSFLVPTPGPSSIANFNFASAPGSATNLRFDGDPTKTTYSFTQGGSAMATTAYRIFLHGKAFGTY